MESLNLSQISDPNERARVFMDAISRLMIDTVESPAVRAELITARIERARRR